MKRSEPAILIPDELVDGCIGDLGKTICNLLDECIMRGGHIGDVEMRLLHSVLQVRGVQCILESHRGDL